MSLVDRCFAVSRLTNASDMPLSFATIGMQCYVTPAVLYWLYLLASLKGSGNALLDSLVLRTSILQHISELSFDPKLTSGNCTCYEFVQLIVQA